MIISERKHERMWKQFLEQYSGELDSMNVWSKHAFTLKLRVKFDMMLHDAGISTSWKTEL